MPCFVSGCLRRRWSQRPVCTFGPRWILARSATVNAACFMSPAVLIFPRTLFNSSARITSAPQKRKNQSHCERAAAFGISPARLLYGEVRFQGGAADFFFYLPPSANTNQSLNCHATPITAAALQKKKLKNCKRVLGLEVHDFPIYRTATVH